MNRAQLPPINTKPLASVIPHHGNDAGANKVGTTKATAVARGVLHDRQRNLDLGRRSNMPLGVFDRKNLHTFVLAHGGDHVPVSIAVTGLNDLVDIWRPLAFGLDPFHEIMVNRLSLSVRQLYDVNKELGQIVPRNQCPQHALELQE